MIKQAVILAGGEGKRLRPFTETNPKPLIPINGKPFLEHLILLLKENKIEEVIILTGYLGEKIESYFGNGSQFGVKIKYSYTPFKNEKGEENESGLRLKNAEPLLDNKFILLYCDNYWPLEISKLEDFYKEKKVEVSLVAYSNKDNFTKNNVLIDKNSFIIKYDKSREEKNLNSVDIGFFIINKSIFNYFPKGNFQFERDVLPKLVLEKKVAGFLTDHRYYSISKPERLGDTSKFLLNKKVVFLDRDGVINKKASKADYIKKWEEFEFLPGAVEAIKNLSQKDYQIYIITNQPGIARGMMTKEDLETINLNMIWEIEKQGGKISGIHYCFHGWDDNCDCRKPKPGLLLKAAKENYIDLTKTLFIGDDERDMAAGQAAGCKTVLIDASKNLLDIVKKLS
jgi:histidinol-phosphate phosphatase family protein